MKQGVSVQTQFAEDLPLIQGDRVQVQQVIINLIINGIEAMSGVGEASRALRTSNGQEASGGVLVNVQDSGPGLDVEGLDRLFDAFYTTKPGGMGMGLSICRSIIEPHGGGMGLAYRRPGRDFPVHPARGERTGRMTTKIRNTPRRMLWPARNASAVSCFRSPRAQSMIGMRVLWRLLERGD